MNVRSYGLLGMLAVAFISSGGAAILALALSTTEPAWWMWGIAWAVLVIGVSLFAYAYVRSQNFARDPTTSETLSETRVGEMNADIYSEADKVASKSQIDRWSGRLLHRPRPRR
jgi:membrane protein implicated in regulation of membrane protease activity